MKYLDLKNIRKLKHNSQQHSEAHGTLPAKGGFCKNENTADNKVNALFAAFDGLLALMKQNQFNMQKEEAPARITRRQYQALAGQTFHLADEFEDFGITVDSCAGIYTT